MSTSNFQLRLDGLRWRIKLIINADSNSNEMLHYPAYAAFADIEDVRLMELYGKCIWSKYTNESRPQSNCLHSNRNSEYSR